MRGFGPTLYIGRANHGPNSNELAQVTACVELNWAGAGLGPGPNIKRPLVPCKTSITVVHSTTKQLSTGCLVRGLLGSNTGWVIRNAKLYVFKGHGLRD